MPPNTGCKGRGSSIFSAITAHGAFLRLRRERLRSLGSISPQTPSIWLTVPASQIDGVCGLIDPNDLSRSRRNRRKAPCAVIAEKIEDPLPLHPVFGGIYVVPLVEI